MLTYMNLFPPPPKVIYNTVLTELIDIHILTVYIQNKYNSIDFFKI